MVAIIRSKHKVRQFCLLTNKTREIQTIKGKKIIKLWLPIMKWQLGKKATVFMLKENRNF